MPRDRIPGYTLHRASGQAVVRLNGQDCYLGTHGTSASRSKYNQLIAEWLAAGRRLPEDPNAITVAEVVNAHRKHAATYYRTPDGRPTSEVAAFKAACRPLLKLYRDLPAIDFSPLKLVAIRDAMIELRWARRSVNKHLVRVKSIFKWAVAQEMFPAAVYHGLQTVTGLRAGRSAAIESEPVKPVPIEHVDAVLPHLSAQVAAMIKLQLLTGMRPGEVCVMRGCDIDTTGKLWLYRPRHHKTRHLGHDRTVYLGPKAQDLLRPFLKLDTQAYLFSPADAERERRAQQHAARTTPHHHGNRPGTNRRRRPARSPGDRYDTCAYNRAVARSCAAAFPPPEHIAKRDGETVRAWKARLTDKQRIELIAWRRDHAWHVHQLRHSAATELRKTFGLEAAQVMLGHKNLSVTEIYAEKNVQAAMRIAAEVG